MTVVRTRWTIPSLLALGAALACGGGSPSDDSVEDDAAGASGTTLGGRGPVNVAGTPSAEGGSGALGGSGLIGGSSGVGVAGSSTGTAGAPSAGAGSAGAPAGTAGGDGSGGSSGSAGASGVGASVGGADGPSAQCRHCAAYAEPTRAGEVEPTALDALSGLAMSPTQPDILFAHNDHDRPVVFALDLRGQEHARITLEGAPATDIEDIAVGPCGSERCVYLADIGDNAARRDEYAVLRFVAPVVPEAVGSVAMTASYERFRFTYEDGSHNAEGMMVSPDGTVYVVTKLAPGGGGRVAATGPSSVYRLPASMSADSVARATKVATLTVPANGELAASAAAAHPCAPSFLLRTYDRVYEFTAPAGMDFEAAFDATPRVVATPDEPQSEGIDYRADGLGFVTAGEGRRAPIVRTTCAP